jgi:ATP-dependent Lon protease
MRDRFSHPALQVLMFSRWDDACGWLYNATEAALGDVIAKSFLDVLADRVAVQAEIVDLLDHLYAIGTPRAGAIALAWQMLTADPRKLASFSMLPQVQFAIDHAELDADDDADVRARVRIWWRAAEGEWTGSEVSIFRIADVETQRDVDVDDQPDPRGELREMAGSASATRGAPTLVVMPKSKASKLNSFQTAYKDLVDAALPLVVVRDVARIRAELHAEFPHAVTAVDLMVRDLREARTFFFKPICLVGAPGSGKSRMVRKLAELVHGLHVSRFDAASSTDSVGFAGSAKSWSNTEPSLPFRAVAQSRTANPVVMVDEIDKAAGHRSGGSGRLVDSLLPFCDRETASRYRDQSLDAEIDLSYVSYIATANDVSSMPAPLRDRFRIVKVPAPTLAHLPALAGNVRQSMTRPVGTTSRSQTTSLPTLGRPGRDRSSR